MLREFGVGFEFPIGTPNNVIEAAMKMSFMEAVKELPFLSAHKYEIVRGPVTQGGTAVAWGWYANMESDEKPSTSVYELTDQLQQVEKSIQEISAGLLDKYSETRPVY